MVGGLLLLTMLEQSKCYEHWMQMTKIYRFFKCFESAQRTFDAKLCVLLNKRRMAYPEILKFTLYPRPYKHLWHWNESVLYLLIVIRQFNVIITKKKAYITLFVLGKDMHFLFGTMLYIRFCFCVKTTKYCCKNPYCSGCSCS